MRKFKLYIDFNKEEVWLNEWLERGYELTNVNRFGMYTFAKTELHNKVIKIDFQVLKTKEQLDSYASLYEEFGWKHISGSKGSSHHYLIKEKDGQDELFSDNPSVTAIYKRLATYYGTLLFPFLIILFALYFTQNAELFYLNPKDAYLTPGLWQKAGVKFWSAFLFETPFALMRFGAIWLLLIMTFLFLYSYLKYQRTAKEKKSL